MLRGKSLRVIIANMSEHAAVPSLTSDMLAAIGLFGGLDDETLEALSGALCLERAPVGHEVVTEGGLEPEMFIVFSGELEVLKHGRSGDVRVALLGPGDWFGEMTILDVQPRSATVRTVAPSVLLRLTSEHVDRLLYRRSLRSYSIFITNVARELSRRLRVADGILAQTYVSLTESYVKR